MSCSTEWLERLVRAEPSVPCFERSEAARSWLPVVTALKCRGGEDNVIAFVDGVIGLPESITTLAPSRGPDSASYDWRAGA